MAIDQAIKTVAMYDELGAELWPDAAAGAREEIPLENPREGELLTWILADFLDRELGAVGYNGDVAHTEICSQHPAVNPSGDGADLVEVDTPGKPHRKCQNCGEESPLYFQLQRSGGESAE